MPQADPFHEGERRVQERAGERAIAERVGAAVSDAIPKRALPFLAEQRLLVAGSVDMYGTVWASVLFGARGLVRAPDERRVLLDRTRIDELPADPLWRNLREHADVGLLAIELESRRRLRINGRVRSCSDTSVELLVREAYANCPKYIQRRHFHGGADAPPATSPVLGVALDADRRATIAAADTFFVASRHPERGVDASHRGGPTGFVRVLTPNQLRIPDYRGNSMFNTLGNLASCNRAGLAFVDFERGRLLQVVGTAEVRYDEAEDPAQPTGGTGRYWHFHMERWQELVIVPRPAWELLDRSPNHPPARV